MTKDIPTNQHAGKGIPSLTTLYLKHRAAGAERRHASEDNRYARPCELPADTLISFSQFADEMPGVTRRWIERASKEGRFVPGVRLTPRSPMMFRAGAVAEFLKQLCAPVQAEVN